MTRTETARQIRNRALILVRHYGRHELIGDQNWFTWRGAGFIVSHRTPLHRLDDPGVARETKHHLAGAPEPLPYGLDIHQGRKVMNLEWGDDDALLIVSFRRGPWENAFLERPPSGITPTHQHMTLQ